MKEIVLIFIFATLLKVNSAGEAGGVWSQEDKEIITEELWWIMENPNKALNFFKTNYRGRNNNEVYPLVSNSKDFAPKTKTVSLKR